MALSEKSPNLSLLFFLALAILASPATMTQTCPPQPLGAEFSPLMVQNVEFPNPEIFASWQNCKGLERLASYRALKGKGSQVDRLALLDHLGKSSASALAYARGTLAADEQDLAWAAISGKSYAPWAALEWARVVLEKGEGERALLILERGVEIGSNESLRPLMALRNRLRAFYNQQTPERRISPLISNNKTRRALDGLLLGMGPWRAVDSRSGLIYDLSGEGQLGKDRPAPAWFGQAFSGEGLWGGNDGQIRVGRHTVITGPGLAEGQTGTFRLVLDGLGGWWSRSPHGVAFSNPGGGGQEIRLRGVTGLAPARSGVWVAVNRGRDLIQLNHQGQEVARVSASQGGWRKIEVLATDPLGLLYVGDSSGTIFWGLPDGNHWRQLAHTGRRPGAISAGVEEILIADRKDYRLTHIRDLP